MLNYVAKGEKIKASTINGIIDSVTNLYYPSDNLNFRTTPQGTLLNSPNSYDIKNRHLAPCFLQTCWSFNLSSTTLYVMLGRDIDEAKKQINIYNKNPDSIYIYDENGDAITEITEDSWPDNKTFFTGFINTGIASLIIDDKQEQQTTKQCGFYGVAYKYEEDKKSSKTDKASDNKSGIYFVLTNSNNDDKIKNKLIDTLSGDNIEPENFNFVDRVLIATQSYSDEEVEDEDNENHEEKEKVFKTHGILQQYRLGPITKVETERLPLPFELKTEIETKQEGTDKDNLKTKYKYKVKMYWYGQGVKKENSSSENGSENNGSENTYDSAIQWNGVYIKGELDDSLKQELENPNQDLNKSGWINIYESKEWKESLEEEDKKFYALIYLRATDVNPISGDYYLSSIIDAEKSKFTITKDARYKQLNWFGAPADFEEGNFNSSDFPAYVEVTKDAPNQVLTYYTIGSIKGTENDLNITQGLIGTQHFVDMSWNNSSGSDLIIDSEISSLTLSSLQWFEFEKEIPVQTENGEELSTTTEIKYLGLYNFNTTSADLSIIIDDENKSIPEYWNILVRENDLCGGATLKYATLSINLSGGNSVSVITDTELTSVCLSSIEKKYSDDISTDYLTLYNFDKTEKDLTLSVSKSNPNLPENYSILVKDVSDDGLITLKYADLSVDYSRAISTDTEVKHLIGTGNTQRSINVVHSKELSGDYLELYNFENGSNGPYKFLPNKLGYEENAYGTKHTFICRQTDGYGTNPEVAYMETKVVYPEGDDSSITYNKNNDNEYKYELYQWNDHTVFEIPVLIDVNNVTREPEELPSIAPCQFLAKGIDGNLNYVDLKLDVKRRVEADSELDDISKTIQLKYHNDIPYFCLYGLDKISKEKTVVLKENEEVNTGIRYVALNGNEIEIQELKIKLPDLSGGGDNTGDIYNISSSVTILSNNVEILSSDVEDIEEQLSNFWVLGADASKCYGTAIGNSSQNEVISLDGQILAGDWQVMGSMVITGDVACDGLTASSYIGCTGDIMCNGLTASSYIGCTGDIMCNGLTASNYVGCTGDMQCDGLYCNNLTCTTVVCDSLTIGGTTINGQQLARLLSLI